MEEIIISESMTDKEFLRLTKGKEPKPEMVKVKCLGWCEKEFMSPSKFLRFCEKCKIKKNKICEDNSMSEHGTSGVVVSED